MKMCKNLVWRWIEPYFAVSYSLLLFNYFFHFFLRGCFLLDDLFLRGLFFKKFFNSFFDSFFEFFFKDFLLDSFFLSFFGLNLFLNDFLFRLLFEFLLDLGHGFALKTDSFKSRIDQGIGSFVKHELRQELSLGFGELINFFLIRHDVFHWNKPFFVKILSTSSFTIDEVLLVFQDLGCRCGLLLDFLYDIEAETFRKERHGVRVVRHVEWRSCWRRWWDELSACTHHIGLATGAHLNAGLGLLGCGHSAVSILVRGRSFVESSWFINHLNFLLWLYEVFVVNLAKFGKHFPELV